MEGYLAVALQGSDGTQIGHIGVMAYARLEATPDEMAVLRIFAARAGAELERRWQEAILREREHELSAQRARVVQAADEERRRIERDLHDGGQQRLVALRIRLELAEELMDRDPGHARSMLHQLGKDVDTAIEELRALAAGVYPSLLAARGLSDAIRTAALQAPVPTTVEVDGTDRYSQEVETAAYFCCIEALQNVAKHAPEASSAKISLSRNGALRFEVRDDGPGFVVEEGATGQGLVNMRDRIAAVGGRLELRSTPGSGTAVVGKIPVEAP
jgi:signal transduction histidine kinase